MIGMSFNPEIHHRRSIRLRNYDYSKSGWYFVTMCTKDRRKYFGKIINGKMVLNREGFIVKRLIKSTEDYFKNIRMDSYQLMPDHIHMIIRIKRESTSGPRLKRIHQASVVSNFNHVREASVGAGSPRPQATHSPQSTATSNKQITPKISNREVIGGIEGRREGGIRGGEVKKERETRGIRGGEGKREGGLRGGETPPQRQAPALGNVIGYFKFMVAKEINQFHQKQKYFIWQRDYFERIIHDKNQLINTRKYIQNNPSKEYVRSRMNKINRV